MRISGFLQLDCPKQLVFQEYGVPLTESNVCFVFLGDRLPKYVNASLELARRNSGLPVVLVTDVPHENLGHLPQIELVDTKQFYDPSHFKRARKNFLVDYSYRENFFSHVVERFFVIGQFMKFTGSDHILHAELDQLLFNLDVFVRGIDRSGIHGFFVPFHLPNVAIASLLYCNSSDAMSSLLDFACHGGPFLNDMDLLATWARSYPEFVVGLPTYRSLFGDENFIRDERKILNVDDVGGVVDAAQLGQWIGGADPRNYPIYRRPRTHFVDPWQIGLLTKQELSDIRFDYFEEGNTLNVSSTRIQQTRLYNVHLHSKIHPWLLADSRRLSQLFDSASGGNSRKLIASQSIQLKEQIKLENVLITGAKLFEESRKKIRRSISRQLRLRPSSYPFLSGDTFREEADLIWEDGNTFQLKDVRDQDVIFCESHSVEGFTRAILQQLEVSATLILGNSDRNFNADLETIASIPAVKKVFCQNLMVNWEKFTAIPIGLENRWHRENGVLKNYPKSLEKDHAKLPRVLWNFTIQTNSRIRRQSADELFRCATTDYFPVMQNLTYYETLRRYAFVASPPGNGFDCHRTWEAIYFGCIPIVLRSFFSEYFQSIGIPMFIVDSYSELKSLSESDLTEIYQSQESNFSNPAIWAQYWFDEIRK